MRSCLLTGVALAACGIALTACSRKTDDAASAPPTGATALHAAPSPTDPLAAAKDPANPAASSALTQAAQDSEDNARSNALAPQLVSHGDWLARQDALCGPNNINLQLRISAAPRPLPPDVRDLKVACVAKDIAHRTIAAGSATPPGVQNTHSL
jgi:hypothetical protein